MNQFIAAYNGKLQWFKENKYDVDAQNSSGETALMHASMYGYKETCELLISSGASVDVQNEYGQTALMIASLNGNKEICTLLLSKGATVDVCDKDGETALMYASKFGDYKECALLLSQGESVDVIDKYRKAALIHASIIGHKSTGSVLETSTVSVLETFLRTARTLKYSVLKTKPVVNNKMLLQWNSYEKEIKYWG